uniref:DNA polymerase epsilon subunit 3 n=1 Tax=Felis catus TaxID=9685 RepID=A0ABI7XYL2_FELCA
MGRDPESPWGRTEARAGQNRSGVESSDPWTTRGGGGGGAGIIKEALPDGVNISKEARSAISRAASVFVLYATSCANNFAMKGKRKTLNASDVLSAMEEMEFQRFVTPLKEALEAYRREQKGKKEASEQKKKDKDKKTDSEEQDKSRDEDNDEDEDRLEEEEPNEEEEVDN